MLAFSLICQRFVSDSFDKFWSLNFTRQMSLKSQDYSDVYRSTLLHDEVNVKFIENDHAVL